jgi:EAL domain-containing protein (putative c-di-GMP-specific phosphodiesterase class I)
MPLFAAAERAGRVVELGRASRRVAVRPLDRLPEPLALFVNLHPHELNDSLLSSAETEVAAYASRLVLEITESEAIRDTKRLARVLDGLRAIGFRIALDDLGSGYAGLNSLSLLKPDFIKLDMSLVRRVATDGGAARLVRHILEFAVGEGMTVIAEGVETEQELEAVRRLDCPLAQGYLLARPSEPFVLLEA